MRNEDYNLLRHISDLFFLVNSEQATESQHAELEKLLTESDTALDLYIDLVITSAGLSEAEGLFGLNKSFNKNIDQKIENSHLFEESDQNEVNDSNVSLKGVDVESLLDVEQSDVHNDMTLAMFELLEYEKNAPEVIIPKKQPVRELIQKVDYSNIPSPKGSGPGKFRWLTTLATAACLIIIIGTAYLIPNSPELPVVARLADSIDAVWDDQKQVPDEFGQMVQTRYRLNKGYASIIFTEGAKITIEAPAELSLNSTGDMELYKGRIYAIVPPQAHGFAVKARGSKIVDLGTEFGVEVDSSSNIQLHVTRGKTRLFARLLPGKESQVDAGAAKKIYEDGSVEDIPLAGHRFVRHIDSAAGTIFKASSDGIRTADTRNIFSVNLWATGAMKEGSGWQDPATHETLKISPGQAAGAGSWRTTGWNNIQFPNPFSSSLPATTITSSQGSTATLKIISQRNAGPWDWTKPRGYSEAVDTGNAVLLTGHANGTSVPSENGRYIFEMMVSGISFGTYDVIVYLGANRVQIGDGTGKVILNGIEKSFKVPASEPDGTLIEGGNFVVIKGISGSSFSLKAMGQGNDGFNHVGPAGFQIVSSDGDTAEAKD